MPISVAIPPDLRGFSAALATVVKAALALERITCTFVARGGGSARYTALKDTTLVVAPGEFVSVVGPKDSGPPST